jgi:hypothetical protein
LREMTTMAISQQSLNSSALFVKSTTLSFICAPKINLKSYL